MCDSPLIAIKYGFNSETGKAKIKLKRRLDFSFADYCKRYGKDNVLLIPCGHCSACILARRREWSIRCQAEAQFHQKNCFVTLTYDDAHLPFKMSQVKDDLKKFIKSIRNSGFKVRYFGCGEEGELSHRKHAHIILFGFMPDDISYDGTSNSGEAIFTSKFIDSLWMKGRAVVQFFDGSVGSYVAGYTSKKLGDSVGFQIQSTRPGIGFQFIESKYQTALKYGKIFGSFGSSSLPRYFEKVISKLGFDFYLFVLKEEIMNRASIFNFQQAREHGFSHFENMIHFNAHFNDKKLQKLERSL